MIPIHRSLETSTDVIRNFHVTTPINHVSQQHWTAFLTEAHYLPLEFCAFFGPVSKTKSAPSIVNSKCWEWPRAQSMNLFYLHFLPKSVVHNLGWILETYKELSNNTDVQATPEIDDIRISEGYWNNSIFHKLSGWLPCAVKSRFPCAVPEPLAGWSRSFYSFKHHPYAVHSQIYDSIRGSDS